MPTDADAETDCGRTERENSDTPAWEDESVYRPIAILSDEDAFKSWCARHGKWMDTFTPRIHMGGAIYTTEDGYNIFRCGECLDTLCQWGEFEKNIYTQRCVYTWFHTWDQGEASGEWFKYIGEGGADEGGVYMTMPGSVGPDGGVVDGR